MDIETKMALLLGLDQETFADIEPMSEKAPFALQRGLAYLCFSTDMSGAVSIDGKIGAGTRRAIDQFCREQEIEVFDTNIFFGEIERALLLADEESFQLNCEYLDRLQQKRFMPQMESYMTYWDLLHESPAINEMGLNQTMVLSLLQVETAGIARVRFEGHVWERHSGFEDRERRFLSTSFGLFQVMGFNLERCGFSVEYLSDQGDIERQCEVLAQFAARTPVLHRELKKADPSYADIAYYYNGPAFRQNQYHVKLAETHLEFKRILGTFGH